MLGSSRKKVRDVQFVLSNFPGRRISHAAYRRCPFAALSADGFDRGKWSQSRMFKVRQARCGHFLVRYATDFSSKRHLYGSPTKSSDESTTMRRVFLAYDSFSKCLLWRFCHRSSGCRHAVPLTVVSATYLHKQDPFLHYCFCGSFHVYSRE